MTTTLLPPRQSAPTRPEAPKSLYSKLKLVEDKISAILQRFSPHLLRGALALVFIWFGVLKVLDVTPVGDLVANTVPFLDRAWFVPALGLFEVALGVALLVGRHLVTLSAVMIAHLCGTFLVLVTQPQIAFQDGNPLLLTTEGEFVVKNLILITAALVVASRFRRKA